MIWGDFSHLWGLLIIVNLSPEHHFPPRLGCCLSFLVLLSGEWKSGSLWETVILPVDLFYFHGSSNLYLRSWTLPSVGEVEKISIDNREGFIWHKQKVLNIDVYFILWRCTGFPLRSTCYTDVNITYMSKKSTKILHVKSWRTEDFGGSNTRNVIIGFW